METRAQFETRLKANVINEKNGDVSILPIPAVSYEIFENLPLPALHVLDFFIYFDPNMDFKELSEIWVKEKRFKENPSGESFLKYFAKRRLKFDIKIPFKKLQINKLINAGIPSFFGVLINDELLEIFLARNEIRPEQGGTKKWREYLDKEERKTIKDIIKKLDKSSDHQIYIIGFNKNMDEYLLQLRYLEKRPCVWVTFDELTAMANGKTLWAVTP